MLPPGGGGGGLSAPDLAGVMEAFNTAAARLQATHEALHAEVRSLKAELLEANQQVERSRRLAALGEMAAGIAHEVRNPLGSIRLYARMLEEDLTDRPESRAVASKIAGAVTRLTAVVGDVLSFAREIKPRLGPADAHELLREALATARSDEGWWSGLTVLAPEGEGPGVACDSGLVLQALVNVIRNAAEAMDASPQGAERVLTLEARSRRRRGSDGVGPSIGLVVRDTGPGIPSDVMKRMFNPFFTTRASGTGLGLAIVHRIVDAHGGRTVVSNGKHGGAVVELVLPAVGAAGTPPLDVEGLRYTGGAGPSVGTPGGNREEARGREHLDQSADGITGAAGFVGAASGAAGDHAAGGGGVG
ncbi:MAG: hypothetical protein JNK35_05750 [Phycisphaerae bacterium]|nr:hypothetical protein [Phycisphaerae bacterium]